MCVKSRGPLLLVLSIICFAGKGHAWQEGTFTASIPDAWDDEGLHSMQLPLVGLGAPPTEVPRDYYDRMRPVTIYRSYPFYQLAQEPSGYYEWLQKQEPEVISFDPALLRTQTDWITAGEAVFNSVIFPGGRQARNRSDPELQQNIAARNGQIPFYRYVVRAKGQVEVQVSRCGSCHVRVQPDGSIVVGAPANRNPSRSELPSRDSPNFQATLRRNFAWWSVPWFHPDPAEPILQWSSAQWAEAVSAEYGQTGVIARPATSLLFPPKIPDLIGVAERKYLDATGITQQRSIADLMRHCAIANGLHFLTAYGETLPFGQRPEPPRDARMTDPQLYALSLFLHSLTPPPNPNQPSELTRRGEQIFRREGCGMCHTPPLYTSNKLTPALGFIVPEEHKIKYDIMPVYIGTDPRLAMETRKATGYYRIPSLKGVWYRGGFEHNGSVATLEDWFDPARLRDDYVPTGFRGVGAKTRAIRGHLFGLALTTDDRAALIAFLKTL